MRAQRLVDVDLDAGVERRGLGLQEHAGLAADRVDPLGQGRDPFARELGREPRAGVEAFDLRQREVRDVPRRSVREDLLHVGRPSQRGVVHDDQRAVTGALDVVLDHVGVVTEGQADGGQGVLRRRARRAAVGNDVDVGAVGGWCRAGRLGKTQHEQECRQDGDEHAGEGARE